MDYHLHSDIVQARKEICEACPTPCKDFPNLEDPCVACPISRWGTWDCEVPEEEGSLEEPPLPSLPQRAFNLTRQSVEEATATLQGVELPSEEEVEKRLEICASNRCGFWRVSDETCSVCGCPMKKKAPWRSARCPVGLW